MIVKRGKVEIMQVIQDDEHNLDDDGTRKAMDKAAQQTTEQTKESKADRSVEN
jgi:hypothetical protein